MIKHNDLARAWIEYSKHDRTRSFKKYWEYRQSPEDEILNLIYSNPEDVLAIIDLILDETKDEWLIELLATGIITALALHDDKAMLPALKAKAKSDCRYKFLNTFGWVTFFESSN